MKNKSTRLSEAMVKMIVMMQEVDDTCVQLTEDISKKDMAIIMFVGDNEQVIMKQIADHMSIPVSTTTGLVDKLVKKKYLRRIYSEEDRRSINIGLDSLGDQAHELMMRLRNDMSGKILDDLSDQESTQLILLLEKVTKNLHQYVLINELGEEK